MKRLLSGLLSLTMVFSLTPSTIVLADDEDNSDLVTQSEEGNGQETNGSSGKIGGAETTSKTEESSLDLNTMSSDELYEYLLNVDDMDALYEEYPNLNDLISKLSEDQRNQLAKKFGNSEEDAEPVDNDNNNTESTNVITQESLVNNDYEITTAGTYTIQGDITTNNKIVINTTDKVTINIRGNISCSNSVRFIEIRSTGDVEINASTETNTYTIKATKGIDGSVPTELICIFSDSTVTINGGIYEYSMQGISDYSGYLGSKTLTLNGCEFSGSAGTAVLVNSSNGSRNVEINDCRFEENRDRDIYYLGNGNITFDGTSVFDEIKGENILLYGDKCTLTLNKDFKISDNGKLKINFINNLSENEQRKIAINTSKDKMSMITSSKDYYVMYKDDGIYFWNHKHTYGDPEVSKDKTSLIETCTNSACNDSIVLATLNAGDVGYTGKQYTGAKVVDSSDNPISGVEYTYQEEQEDGNYVKISEAPTNVGKYRVKASFAYEVDGSWPIICLQKDFEITNTITPSQTITIKDGGEYTVVGGTYNLGNDDEIVVDTSENVTLYIKGDLDLQKCGGINVKSNSGAVTINGTKNDDGSDSAIIFYGMSGFFSESQKPVTFNNLRLKGEISKYTQGQLAFNNCDFGYDESSISFNAMDMEFNNCSFGSARQIFVRNNGNVKLKGKNTFDDSSDSYDVYLNGDSTITLDKSFTTNDNYKLKVNFSSSLDDDKKRKITVDTSKDMVDMITSSQGYYAIYEDGDIYFWNHQHTYGKPEVNEKNKDLLIMKCEECDHYEILATLNATNSSFTGSSYGGASVEENSAYADDIQVGEIKYKEKDTEDECSTTAPTQPGNYTASVEVRYTVVYSDETIATYIYTLQKDFEITNTIKPSSDKVTITKGGEYNVEGGDDYTADYSGIVICTADDEVILNILGNITYTPSEKLSHFIRIQKAKNVKINASSDNVNHEIKSTDTDGNLIKVDYNSSSKVTLTLNGGVYNYQNIAVSADSKTISSLNLNGTTFNGRKNNYGNKASEAIYGSNVNVKNCTFGGDRKYDIMIADNSNLTLEGENAFATNDGGNNVNIALGEGATLTLKDDFSNSNDEKLRVDLAKMMQDNEAEKITKDTSKDMIDKITSTQGYTAIYKDNAIYFWNHTHDWKYKLDNVNYSWIKAYCDNKDCEYYASDDSKIQLSAVLSLKESTSGIIYKYNGQPYDGIQFKNGISDVTGAKASTITYKGINGTEYEESTDAPTDAGEYSASVTVGEVTAHVDFEILKADQKAPSGVSSTNETIKGKKDGSITGVDSSMEYRKKSDDDYTSIDGTSITDLAAGTYYVRYAGDENHNASDDVEVVIEDGVQLLDKVEVTMDTPVGGENLSDSVTCKTTGVKSATLNWTDTDGHDVDKVANYYPWTYQAHITITPDSGYVFDENTKVVVNGSVLDRTMNEDGSITAACNYASTKHKVTKISIPSSPETFSNFYSSENVISGNSELVKAVNAVVDGKETTFDVTWSVENYDSTDGATNTFMWSLNLDDEEYEVSDSCKTSGTVKIKNKKLIPIEVTGRDATVKYDGNTIDVSKYFTIGEHASDTQYNIISGTGAAEINGSILTVVDVGTFTIQLTAFGDETVYDDGTAQMTLTVNKGDITYSANGYDGTYDGNAHSINVTTDANVVYSTDSVHYSETNPSFIDAGEYTVYYKIENGSNYNVVSDSKKVKISPKTVTVTATSASKIYGDKDPDLTYTISGVDTLSGIKVNRVSGEDIGTYDIKLSVDKDANPNYSVTCKSGTFTIKPKDISEATVTLGNALVYTGSEQTQEVKSVKLDGKDVTYSVSGNVVTDVGKHTLTVTGTGNFTGTVSVDYVVASNKMEETKDGKVSVGEGTATVEVKGDAKLETTKAELLEMLIQNGSISAEELEAVYNGSSDLNISLNVNEYVGLDEGTKSKMIDGASSSGLTISNQFLDITLLVNDHEIHSTGMVKASVVVPDSLINTDSNLERTYYMVRYHEGKVSCLEGKYNEKSHSFTFETDKFSAYALAYKDVVKKTSDQKETKKDYGKGTIVLDSNESNSDLIDSLIKSGDITEEELKNVSSGGTLNISLKVTDVSSSVSSDEKTSIKKTVESLGYTIGNQYVNIGLYKNAKALSSTTSKVSASVSVPETMVNTDRNIKRTYYVVGSGNSVECSFDEKTNSITFETNTFGSYALAYKDVVKKTSGEKETTVNYGDGKIVSTNSEIIDSLIKSGDITSEELEKVKSGGTLNISLKVTDSSNSVSSEVKSTVQQTAKRLGYTVGNQYVDINLYKDAKIIKTTSGKVKASVSVPDTMVNTNSNVKRTYYAIGYCDGKVVTIEGIFDEETKSFTFETNQFSTYVLAYKDTAIKQSETKTDTINKSDSKQSTKKSTNTGVQSNMGLYIALVIVSMIGLVVLIKKKRFEW